MGVAIAPTLTGTALQRGWALSVVTGEAVPADAGLHALAWFRSAKDLPLLLRARPTLGVKISPLAAFCIDASLPPALLLGFAAWSPAQIREGLITLARALDERPMHINHKALRNNRAKSRSV